MGHSYYDFNGIEVCDCYDCERDYLKRERDKFNSTVDWSKFPMQISTKVNSKCSDCARPIKAGSEVMWAGPRTGRVTCLAGKCKQKGWQLYPARCPFCREPFTGEHDFQTDYEEWADMRGEFACGTTMRPGTIAVEDRSIISPACHTIKKLKKRLDKR